MIRGNDRIGNDRRTRGCGLRKDIWSWDPRVGTVLSYDEFRGITVWISEAGCNNMLTT